MAKPKLTKTPPPTPSNSGYDPAFNRWVVASFDWARGRTQTVVAGSVVAVLLVAAVAYYLLQRSERLDLAAAELETIQFVALVMEGPQAEDELRAYIDRFSGTPYAIEAYLLLGEHFLQQEQPEAAVSALQEIGPSFRSPLHVQAAFLLAVAFEQAARSDDAAELYQELLDRAEFTFQEREAGEGLARAELARGNTEGAIAAYEAVLAVLDPEDPTRSRFEMRLAELRAQTL